MSSSAGYDYSYVDVEAAQRRAVLADLARLQERAKTLRAQEAALRKAYGFAKVRVPASTMPADRTSASSSELAAQLAGLSAVLDEAERGLNQRVAAAWSSRMSAQPARTGEPARLDESAHDGTTAGRTSDRADTAEAVRLARVRANAIADAEALLGLEAARCDPEDFERLRRRLAELHRGGSVDEVRRTLTDLTAGMAHAVNRWKRAAQVEQARVELCDQLQDALPEEREDLLAAVRSAAEPDSLRGLVANALARADRARSRLAVAAAVTETLRGMQYEVGEEFGDILAETGVGVVTFTLDELTGYGLRIQLPRDGGPLGTAVVRRSDADPARDRYVQQRFCDEHLTVFERGLQRGGVNLTPRGRVQPGMLPAPPVPSDGWPPPARERPRRGPKRRSGSAGAAQHQQDAARERSRER